MKLLDIAITQLGVTEDAAHTNHGEAIKYQDAAGLPKGGGFPWCASYVFWCGLQAYGAANMIPKTGGVIDCWNKAKAEGIPTIDKANATPDNIKPGYQFILDLGKGQGHTGLVVSVNADGSMQTIEGNSNPAGGRDGYCVAYHTRHLSDAVLKGFICYSEISS